MKMRLGKVASAIAVNILIFSISLSAATVTWVGGSGDWNTAANWSSGALPGINDDVVINPTNTAITVTHSSGSHAVNSLTGQVAFQLNGGTLTVSNSVQVDNISWLMNGGTLGGGVVSCSGGASLVVNGQSSVLDGVVKTLLKCPHSHSGENVPFWFN
jgi:hypothetical protein